MSGLYEDEARGLEMSEYDDQYPVNKDGTIDGCNCNFCLRARTTTTEKQLASYQPPMGTFWVVMNIDTKEMRCTFRHGSLDVAKKECERLAKKEGGTFAVFAMVACISPIVVHAWRDVETPLPF